MLRKQSEFGAQLWNGVIFKLAGMPTGLVARRKVDLNPARTSHLVALSRAMGPEIGATSSRTSSGPQNTQRTPSATARGAPGATNTALRSSPV